MLEKTTCRKICQKRPPTGGGTSGQATRGTCRLGRRRHGGAATANAGTSAAVDGRSKRWVLPPLPNPAGMRHVTLPATAKAACPTAVTCQPTCRTWGWRHPHAGVGPGGTCHVSPGQTCRHPQGVLFDKKFRRWSFLAFHSHKWSYVSKIRGWPGDG
jgi:hypothetical protein